MKKYGYSAVLDTNVSLIGNIEDLMHSDDADRQQQSNRLISLYRTASDPQRVALDAAFVMLCGYSLKTLMKELGELAA